MRKIFNLTPNQWEVLIKAFSNISQGVILFSLAAFFVPNAVGLPNDFQKPLALVYLFAGFFGLIFAIMVARKGN